MFQLIQNVNISFEICANVFGPSMDPYKDHNNFNISLEIYVNVFQLIQNFNISFEIYTILSGMEILQNF